MKRMVPIFTNTKKEDGTGDILRLTKEQAAETKTLRIGAVSDQNSLVQIVIMESKFAFSIHTVL